MASLCGLLLGAHRCTTHKHMCAYNTHTVNTKQTNKNPSSLCQSLAQPSAQTASFHRAAVVCLELSGELGASKRKLL